MVTLNFLFILESHGLYPEHHNCTKSIQAGVFSITILFAAAGLCSFSTQPLLLTHVHFYFILSVFLFAQTSR